MARSSSDFVGLLEGFEEERVQKEEDDEEEEEEEAAALSLCDFPVNVMKEKEEEPLLAESSNQQEEFEFGRGGSGSLSVRSEMCAAEDIFYRGQMLPLGHSFDSSYEKVKNIVNRGIISYSAVNKIPSFAQSMSRSESMDHVLERELNSFSSNSSSRSIAKTSSFSTGNTELGIATTTTRNANSKPKKVNQFQISHPSPRPQMMRHSNQGPTHFSRSRTKSSSMWDFFKLGLVRTPELQDLNKVRTGGSSVSRNSSSGSSNSNPKSVRSPAGGKQIGFLERRGGAMLSGCSCTVSAVVKPIPLNATTVQRDEDMEKVTSAQRKNSKHRKKVKKKETTTTTEDKLEGKQEMSRHRTFEWIKELSQSHASYIHENNHNTKNNIRVVEKDTAVASSSC